MLFWERRGSRADGRGVDGGVRELSIQFLGDLFIYSVICVVCMTSLNESQLFVYLVIVLAKCTHVACMYSPGLIGHTLGLRYVLYLC